MNFTNFTLSMLKSIFPSTFPAGHSLPSISVTIKWQNKRQKVTVICFILVSIKLKLAVIRSREKSVIKAKQLDIRYQFLRKHNLKTRRKGNFYVDTVDTLMIFSQILLWMRLKLCKSGTILFYKQVIIELIICYSKYQKNQIIHKLFRIWNLQFRLV